VLSPGTDAPRDFEVKSKIKNLPQQITFSTYFRMFDDFYDEENDKHRFWKFGQTTLWKMPSWSFDPTEVDSLIDRVKGGGSLILDLRGNGGGYVETMERVTGSLFDRDVKIADVKSRKKTEISKAKSSGKSAFMGKIVVLIDSQSGSASEVFARLIQIEKRGTVIGDVSAGAVMQSIMHTGEIGTMSVVPFGVSVTNADVIMTDGLSLEKVGVVPDELILTTGADLAAKRDPVLARAVAILGGTMSAEDAGQLYKYYWKQD